MSSPQKENGYTAIANELMEALARFRIPGEQMQCLLVIIRKTYGFNKTEDMIANSQFVSATGLKKGNVSRAIKSLVEKRIVIKNDNTRIPTYRFNKNYRMWKLLSKMQPVIKDATPVIKSDNRVLSKVMDTKDIITKDIITKDSTDFKFKRKVSLPTNIFLTDRMRVYVEDQGCANGNHAEGLFENFKNHHGAKGSEFKDWTLAYFKWVRQDKEWHPDLYKPAPDDNQPTLGYQIS